MSLIGDATYVYISKRLLKEVWEQFIDVDADSQECEISSEFYDEMEKTLQNLYTDEEIDTEDVYGDIDYWAISIIWNKYKNKELYESVMSFVKDILDEF